MFRPANASNRALTTHDRERQITKKYEPQHPEILKSMKVLRPHFSELNDLIDEAFIFFTVFS